MVFCLPDGGADIRFPPRMPSAVCDLLPICENRERYEPKTKYGD